MADEITLECELKEAKACVGKWTGPEEEADRVFAHWRGKPVVCRECNRVLPGSKDEADRNIGDLPRSYLA